MLKFIDRLNDLKARVTGATAANVLGAPPGEVVVRSPAVTLGASQLAAGKNRSQDGEIPEVRSLFWGNPTPGGGVTIFTTSAGYALLQDEDEAVRISTATRIARWVMSQERWMASKSPRSTRSVANEILCHAHAAVDDRDMSIEYFVDPQQQLVCLALGLSLDELAAPDEGVV